MPTRKSSEKGLHDASDCDTFAGDAVREGAGRCVAGRVDVYVELVLWAGDPTLDALGADGEGPAAHLACGRRRGWNIGVVRWVKALAAWG